MSVKKALENYSRKHMGIKRERPEKQVEKSVLEWCARSGFDISVVESKAVYSRSAGRYLRGQTEAGFSDLVGVTSTGRACFIELKAEGKRSTLKPHQYDFLLRKIKLGAFACCVDSVELIDSIYTRWLNIIDIEPETAKAFLEDNLHKSKRTKEMFDDAAEW